MNTSMSEKIFDHEAALQRCGGHPGPLRRYVDLLEGEYRQLLASAEQCIARKDAHGLKRAAYKLGWHASNLSAPSALDAALHLESIGRTGDLRDAPEALHNLEEELDRLRSAISALY
jgi:HPt (histidine-containing phosphotransfer) domain-containing protein